MELTDAHLVARVLADDDRHAFAHLVRRYQSQIRALLRRLTGGDHALADDLAQETFLRAYKGLRGYRGGAKISSWLYRIAYNRFLSHKASAKQASEDAESLADMDRGPSDQVSLKLDLERAMRVLHPNERAAVALSYGMEATHEDIAAVLDCPLGTVKTHIARGKEKLRRRLRAWAPARHEEQP